MLAEILARNAKIRSLLGEYINETPRAITEESVRRLADEAKVSPEEAFSALFSVAVGLDTEENEEHLCLETEYLAPGLCRLLPEEYRKDAYLQTIHITKKSCGDCELTEGFYDAFEPFVRNHPVTADGFREIPQIGYFEERFSYPVIRQGGIDWMTVTPNEIETMKKPIENACGRVLTLGLGLGYYAFHVSQKETVEKLTVIECNKDIIRLFREQILPQFPHPEKIEIIESDAFGYLDAVQNPVAFHSIFCDLWHDQSDGLKLYLKLRKYERKFPLAKFDYWIEPTMLQTLRTIVFRSLEKKSEKTGTPIKESLLTDSSLKKISLNL